MKSTLLERGGRRWHGEREAEHGATGFSAQSVRVAGEDPLPATSIAA